jgi:hypothetical protein
LEAAMKWGVVAAALLLAAGAAEAYDKPRWKDPGHPDAFPKNFGYKDPHPPLFPKNFGYKPPKEERHQPSKSPSFAPDFGPDRVYSYGQPRGAATPGFKREPMGGGKWNDRVR